MGLKAWVKAPGTPAVIPAGYSQEVVIGSALVRLTALPGSVASQTLADKWQQLEPLADAPLFLSWPWVHSWLEEVVGDRQVITLEVHRSGNLIALAAVTLFERKILGRISRVAFLNELPLAGYNMVVEKNGTLARRGQERESFFAAMNALADSDLGIEELRCNAIDERHLDKPRLGSRFSLLAERGASCWLLGKAETPLASGDLLRTFSKNRRSQIGRFWRLLEKEHGAVTVTLARDEEQAWNFFSRLEILHTRYWRAQGLPGSFANPRWKAFHWRLIRELLPSGRVQLVRITAGREELGYLYNIGQGRVMSNMQSGFAYRDDNRWRPGYVSHLIAAESAATLGCQQYDLLMGDDGYKSSIARAGSWLEWLSLFPKRLGWRNRRYWLRLLLELYRWVRTSSKPNAQGDPIS